VSRPLQPGAQLLHYRLVDKIGEGGMGVVWRAADTKLDRDVAIKILPAAFSSDPERLARFRREAKLLASVNHPNVAAIYGIESVDDTHFLVLELVPGQGLDELLKAGALPPARALEIARGVAEGLQAAHATDIIHRDLKPANVRITPEGKVKVLDFGLARAGEAPATQVDSSLSPTVTSAGTKFGVILGTAAYMSPEQARGQQLDRRTDVWSFGCLLYECLTGTRPFGGATVSDSIARILERNPDLEALPAETPPSVRALLTQCLQKDRDGRPAEMGQAIAAFDSALSAPAPAAGGRGRLLAIGIPVVLIAILAAWMLSKDDEGAPAPAPAVEATKKMMAVLPFDNMGPAEDEYFAEGMSEEISARLASIDGLGLIGRTSAMQYKDSSKTVRQIGDELNIDYMLDGTVRWQRSGEASRVRVTPQLIRVSDASQIWTQVYEAEMSDIFEVQSDIAGQVADALDLALGVSAKRTLDERPTDNVEAYDFYLRGLDYSHNSYLENNLRIAAQMYEKAIELDPEFALAWATLANCHESLYWFYYDRSPERLAMAKEALDTALRLDPDLPEAHLVMGWYHYHGFLDYEAALASFAIAEREIPDDLDLHGGIASVHRRQGKWEAALARFERMAEIDPRSAHVAKYNLDTKTAMRRYDEALVAADRLIELAPDDRTAYVSKAFLIFSSTGDIDRALSVLDEAIGADEADTNFGTTSVFRIRLKILAGEYEEALRLLDRETTDVFLDNQFLLTPGETIRGLLYGLTGQPEQARAAYESARRWLEARMAEHPDDPRLPSALGIALAGLGLKDEAVAAAKRGVAMYPVSKEAWVGAYREQELAQVYAMVGEVELAREKLDYVMSIPSELSERWLQAHPAWQGL
jgi:non-specific serine/threonine protein kinase